MSRAFIADSLGHYYWIINESDDALVALEFHSAWRHMEFFRLVYLVPVYYNIIIL